MSLAGDWSNRRRLLENASIFCVRCIAAEAFLVLREIAVGLRPHRAKPEEAQASPRGTRSLVRKSPAVFNAAKKIPSKTDSTKILPLHTTFFQPVNNFFRVFSSSTTVIDKVYTVSCVVENFSPQDVSIVDNQKKTLHQKVLFDIIIVFSLLIIINIKIVINRLWIRCGQLFKDVCKHLSTDRFFCRKLLFYYIICYAQYTNE
jgi:hypothetical protein